MKVAINLDERRTLINGTHHQSREGQTRPTNPNPTEVETMNTIRATLQHYLNPLHVMCRLMDTVGLPARRAAVWAMAYEQNIYRPLQNIGLI